MSTYHKCIDLVKTFFFLFWNSIPTAVLLILQIWNLGARLKKNKIKIGSKIVRMYRGKKTEKTEKRDRKLDIDGGQKVSSFVILGPLPKSKFGGKLSSIIFT